ncbi:MAG: chemotaxis protein CheW, partial [Cyanobacteria bacterium REEB65]|nr:chemotaxis protein CheW [Cyanobacteria bacterium REEB65]
MQVVTFFLGGEEYALNITRIREIIGMTTTTRLPLAAPHITGLINLRGEVIPVFDMRKWFGLVADSRMSLSTIIAEWHGETFGFTVDSVHQVMWLAADQVDPPSAHFEKRSPYILGLGKYEQRVVILLDLDALFKDVEEE